MGNKSDIPAAIEHETNAFPAFSCSSKEQLEYLQKLHDALMERIEDLQEVTIGEYGATVQRSPWLNRYAAETFLYFRDILQDFDFERSIGKSRLSLVPVGVTAIMTVWNANSGSIRVKPAAA